MLIRIVSVVLFFLIIKGLFAQDKPMGKFLKKDIQVGAHIQYALSFKYPINQDIIFPDSAYPYTPFEFIEKRYFKTVSDSTNSFDSAVYTLATFEIDSIQHLALPVFLIENEDTIKLFATPDSISIIPSLTVLPDSAKLMENTNFLAVNKEFNFRYLFIGTSLILLFIVLFTLIFGKTLIKNLKIRKLRKQHYRFLLSFKELNGGISRENFIASLADMYFLWKKYIQQVSGHPYTTYSSKEIISILKNESLKKSLHDIDRGIYAHRFPEDLERINKNLIEVAQKFYNNKLLQIRHGAKR